MVGIFGFKGGDLDQIVVREFILVGWFLEECFRFINQRSLKSMIIKGKI